MTNDTPRKPREHSPYTCNVNTELVRFTVRAYPPDEESLRRKRKGRPARSPSDAPDNSTPDQNPPPAT
jgi:hypothetical protein